MWIFQNDSQLSIVSDYTNPKNFMVRARLDGDIERAIPSVDPKDVQFGVGTDYAYRASVPREDVMAAIANSIDAIDYTNFKNSIPKKDHGRASAYTKAWAAMFDLQQLRNPIESIYDRWNDIAAGYRESKKKA